jgi:hypothetical protein
MKLHADRDAGGGMTPIRAHVPMETPAGPMVALPPCDGHIDEPGEMCACLWDRPAPPDVFALAVPCPTPLIVADGWDHSWCGRDPARPVKCQNGWVHHGDYRVLDVLAIVDGFGKVDDPMPRLCVITDAGDRNGVYLLRPFVHPSPTIDIPAAVPGGVALIVEPIEPK